MNTFKKTVTNLEQVSHDERQDRYADDFKKLLASRGGSLTRHGERKMERLINQFNCSQEMNLERIAKVQQLEDESPGLFDELQNRKKQTHIAKNTTKAIKDSGMNNAYWNLLNHAPASQVKQVVTPRVLDMDRQSCDILLKGILQDKQQENTMRALQQRERRASLNKLAHKHNERLALAQRLGVKHKGHAMKASPNSRDREDNVAELFKPRRV